MEIDEELLKEMRKNERAREREDLYYAEEPDWMIYQERDRTVPLNEFGGVFQKKDETSVNTAPSVFEKGTIFKTGKNG